MAEIKRVNIYVGVVGQAYVDKETALANLNAAIKNVHDMEEIIASAQEQQPVAQTVLDNAIAAQTLAQAAYDQLSGKFGEQSETDALYVQLLNILNDLNINDTDKNPYNGGSTKTAQENVADINKQITELAQIIADGQESLQRRLAFVDELQVIYDNAVEKFKSYLPEEEGYDWEAWDKEEELLKARIQAVIDALARANEITDAINDTSKDVIVRAVETILAVCYKNESIINDIYSNEYQYLNELENINNQLSDLRGRASAYDYTYNGQLLVNNISNDLDTVSGLMNELRDVRIPSINNLNSSVNVEAISKWENIQTSINEYFNVNDFDASVQDIYYINDQIKQHNQFLTEVKNRVKQLNNSINRYESEYQTIASNEGSQDWPDTIEQGGITYYREDPGNPGEGYDQFTVDYNGRTYYAWVANEAWHAAPDTIEFEGRIYTKRMPDAPGDNYTLLTHTENGITYYAWVANGGGEPQPGELYFSIGTTPITAENYTTANNVQMVAEYPTQTEYIPTERAYIYILVKDNKTVQVIDVTTNAPAYISEDTTTIPGYKIVSPNGKVGGNVYIRIS